MNVLAVIPARFHSQRFCGKPLASIAGKPMIQHVFERVQAVPFLDEILVATDDERIFQAVESFGGQAMMTSSKHQTGTDRILEVLEHKKADWILNVQGDEPTISPKDLENLMTQTFQKPNTLVSTLVFKTEDPEQLKNPNIVKAVCSLEGKALYFSRATLPYFCSKDSLSWAWKHLGTYLYRYDFLKQYSTWSQTPLELKEQLEQLRILEHGVSIFCVEAAHESVGVDVPEDLLLVQTFFENL